MDHSRPDTTQAYTDDLELDDLADVLSQVAEDRARTSVVRLDYRKRRGP